MQYYSALHRCMMPMTPREETTLDLLTDPSAIPPRPCFQLPELRLLVAVLEEGIACAIGRVRQASSRCYEVRVRALAQQEALRWLASERDWGPFSFVGLCLALDLDHHRIRTAAVSGATLKLPRPMLARSMGRICAR